MSLGPDRLSDRSGPTETDSWAANPSLEEDLGHSSSTQNQKIQSKGKDVIENQIRY